MEGLEEAWVSGGLECIAVKGNLAAYVTVRGQGQENEEGRWKQPSAPWRNAGRRRK